MLRFMKEKIMNVNFGFFISKTLRFINRPALRDCVIAKNVKVGTGSNLVNVKIDSYSYTGKNCSISNTTIGKFCSIGSYCAIGGGQHPLDLVSTSPIFLEGKNVFRKNLSEIKTNINLGVSIGNDVWIGESVFISAGVKIGDGAVVGAHSVVTHNVPPYAIVAGAPAKILRYRFDQTMIEEFENLKWWNWNENKLKECGELFSEPSKFINTYSKKYNE